MQLRPYQIRIANWLCNHPHACLSVGMGLGKTAATLHFVDHTLQLYPAATFLIVAPKRVAETVWMQEAEKWELWTVARNMALVAGTQKQKEAAATSSAPVKIVSRDNLKYFENQTFDVLVIDELTSFKNMKSQRTKAVKSIHATRKIGLTGTFAPNGLLDVYAQLAVLDIAPNDERDFYAWRGRWFVDINASSSLPYPRYVPRAGVTEAAALGEWAKDIITLTTEDYLQLPAIQYKTVEVTLAESERKAYDDMVATLHFEMPGGLDDFTVDEKARFAKIQTLCSGFVYDTDGQLGDAGGVVRIDGGGSKIQAAVEFCRHAAAEGESVLMFYQYRESAVWFGEEAQKAGLRIASVGGKNNDWLRLWNTGNLDVLVANPASAGHGLNLQQGGHIVLWLELTYNYEYYAQANARLHRTGQLKPVQVWTLEAKDTVDGNVRRLLANKDKTNKRIESITKR